MVLNYMLKALFVYNFDSGVNFCRENFCGEIFFAGTFFVDREKKNVNIAKIRTHKNLVPHAYTLVQEPICVLAYDQEP